MIPELNLSRQIIGRQIIPTLLAQQPFLQALSNLTTGVMYPIGPAWHVYTIQCSLIAVTLLQVILMHSTYNLVQFVVGSVPNRSPNKVRLVRSAQKIRNNSAMQTLFFEIVYSVLRRRERKFQEVIQGVDRNWLEGPFPVILSNHRYLDILLYLLSRHC